MNDQGNDATRAQSPLGRRGLIAAAAALVATTLAKQTAQDVGAQGESLIVGNSVVSQGGYQVGTAMTWLASPPIAANPSFRSTNGFVAAPADPKGDGIQGFTAGANVAGTFGRNNDDAGVGTWGEAPKGTGAFGDSGNGSGVAGSSVSGRGVYGLAISGVGVYGIAQGGDATATSTIGVYGVNLTPAPNSHGIIGLSNSGHGLVGTSSGGAPGGVPYAGLVGQGTNGSNAGNFYGNVSIAGTLNGHGAIVQQANVAVAHPDGTHRLAYPVVSTESWLEDVGKGTLANGQATIAIDPAFAAIADLNDYHVFLTEYGDHQALFVGKQTAQGFEVRAKGGVESAGPAGAVLPSGKFSWRVLARRQGAPAQRLAKYEFPKLDAPKLDASSLPTPPRLPAKRG